MDLKSSNFKINKPEDNSEQKENTKLQQWREYKKKNGTDFILDEADRLMETAGDDPDIKAGVYTTITQMLFEYPREYQRTLFIKMLGRRHKPMKIWKDEYKIQKELRDEEEEAEKAPTSEADTTTVEKYGFYTENNRYYFATPSGWQEGTNFILEPLFHVYSMTNNRRLIRITNESDYSILCDVPSEALVSAERFQNFIFSEGNFLVFANNSLFKKLLRYIGDKFPKCYEIRTFGWQPEGFWAFANGSYNGKWTEVDEMGIMRHEDKNYFSPAFSKVYSELRTDDDVYENDRKFIYKKSDTTIEQWSDLVQLVYAYGNNGQYAVAFLTASLFRNEIYSLYKIFPHLFLHGEKASGKSQMAWSLSSVFQSGSPPFNLSAGTDVAFFRWLARYRNVVIWYDEYTDNIDEKRFQALKSAYDGVGREKGKMSKDSRTESDKINSASVISGQHLPQRDDNSLYTRSIVRFFVKPKSGYTKKQAQLFDKLKRTEEKGLSQIITTLLNQREKVESKFARIFNDTFEEYKEQLLDQQLEVDDRILRNYTILSSIVLLFQKHTPVDLKINPELFKKQCLQDAIEQSDKVSSSDALGTFWKILGGLIQENRLTGTDYDMQLQTFEKIAAKRSGQKKSEQVNFIKPTWVLYLDFDRAYQKYMEIHRSVYGTAGLGFQTMIDYAHNHWGYIGLKDSHYFQSGNGKRTSAHMFNYTELVEKRVMPDFKDILEKEDNTNEETDNSWMEDDNKNKEVKNARIDFSTKNN